MPGIAFSPGQKRLQAHRPLHPTPSRVAKVLLACECDARGRLGLQDAPYPQRPRLQQALQQVQAVATARVAAAAAAHGAKGPQIGAAVRAARLAALRAA